MERIRAGTRIKVQRREKRLGRHRSWRPTATLSRESPSDAHVFEYNLRPNDTVNFCLFLTPDGDNFYARFQNKEGDVPVGLKFFFTGTIVGIELVEEIRGMVTTRDIQSAHFDLPNAFIGPRVGLDIRLGFRSKEIVVYINYAKIGVLNYGDYIDYEFEKLQMSGDVDELFYVNQYRYDETQFPKFRTCQQMDIMGVVGDKPSKILIKTVGEDPFIRLALVFDGKSLYVHSTADGKIGKKVGPRWSNDLKQTLIMDITIIEEDGAYAVYVNMEFFARIPHPNICDCDEVLTVEVKGGNQPSGVRFFPFDCLNKKTKGIKILKKKTEPGYSFPDIEELDEVNEEDNYVNKQIQKKDRYMNPPYLGNFENSNVKTISPYGRVDKNKRKYRERFGLPFVNEVHYECTNCSIELKSPIRVGNVAHLVFLLKPKPEHFHFYVHRPGSSKGSDSGLSQYSDQDDYWHIFESKFLEDGRLQINYFEFDLAKKKEKHKATSYTSSLELNPKGTWVDMRVRFTKSSFMIFFNNNLTAKFNITGLYDDKQTHFDVGGDIQQVNLAQVYGHESGWKLEIEACQRVDFLGILTKESFELTFKVGNSKNLFISYDKKGLFTTRMLEESAGTWILMGERMFDLTVIEFPDAYTVYLNGDMLMNYQHSIDGNKERKLGTSKGFLTLFTRVTQLKCSTTKTENRKPTNQTKTTQYNSAKISNKEEL
ncbi:hypothetical protein M3Y96_01189300 [Aphelenchoides besseyi]|nr:hypothetical protein M3Y96_01189300 [Aphelenchoides besseyi]